PYRPEGAMQWKAMVGATAALVALAGPARADAVADFYRGKSVSVLVGFTAGGGYDLYARLLGRHIGRHIPGNPSVVVQNMPGAGSLKATQYVYGVAPKDGTVLATVSRGMATEPLLNEAKFDATRFTWIGSVTSETSICATWHTSPTKTWDDMFKREFTLGGSAAGADPDTFALILRNVFDATMKDRQFLEEAGKIDLEVTPVTGAAIDTFLAELYRTPKDVVRKAVAAIQK